MDPDEPLLETETRRRRRRSLFRHRRVPVRMLVPNFFTLLGLCAGLTSIRMGIEGRYDLALAAIVFAACLDGIDGRIARLLKASSRFGAELDSLADFVNFGVAPAFSIFNWGLGDLKSAGWICVMIFALASALRSRGSIRRSTTISRSGNRIISWACRRLRRQSPFCCRSTSTSSARSAERPVGAQDRARLYALSCLHDGVDDPDLFGKAARRTRRTGMGIADFRRRHRRRRHAVSPIPMRR